MNNTTATRDYTVLRFDALGREIGDDDKTQASDRVLKTLASDPSITDLFVMAHGWEADVLGAYAQFDSWLASVKSLDSGHDYLMGKSNNKFKPLIVGVHWPSKVRSDGGITKSASDELTEADLLILVGDESKDALKRVISSLDQLQTRVGVAGDRGLADNFNQVVERLRQPLDKVGGALNLQCLSDKLLAFKDAFLETAREYGFQCGRMLFELLSFWRMRERAMTIGQIGAYGFLQNVVARSANKNLRIHLAGHSFGCIVVSAAVCGANCEPISGLSTVILLQGALSLWSYCGLDPTLSLPGHPFAGQYSELRNRVSGVVAATTSKFDRAVQLAYPLAASLWELGEKRQAAKYKPYGALGAFGARGDLLSIEDLNMLPPGSHYTFAPDKIYNVASDDYICHILDVFSGAHCDIANEGVAHLIYEAAGGSI